MTTSTCAPTHIREHLNDLLKEEPDDLITEIPEFHRTLPNRFDWSPRPISIRCIIKTRESTSRIVTEIAEWTRSLPSATTEIHERTRIVTSAILIFMTTNVMVPTGVVLLECNYYFLNIYLFGCAIAARRLDEDGRYSRMLCVSRDGASWLRHCRQTEKLRFFIHQRVL